MTPTKAETLHLVPRDLSHPVTLDRPQMTFLFAFTRARSRAWLATPLLLGLAACGASESDETSDAFVVGTSEFGVAASTPLEVQGDWLAFLADEAASGASPLNLHDTDTIDQVAVVINTRTRVERNLRVAAESLLWVGSELFLVVDELLDNHDWDQNMNVGELVLLHWNNSLTDPVFVDTLDRNSPTSMVTVDSTLFIATDHVTGVAGESSLYAVDAEFPTTPRPVFTQDTSGGLRPRLIGQQDGLVLLFLDETVMGDNRDLNGDGNSDDAFVLALLNGEGIVDASGYTLSLRNTELAIADENSPIRAVSTGSNDWLVGFLVDETAQELSLNRFGGGNLPASWQIGACLVDDMDLDDQVLHALRFADWDMDPVVNAPFNSGLAGGQRVLIVGDAVGTICLESDEGPCIFNGDGDSDDSILRWIRIDGAAPLGSNNGPVRTVAQLVALDTNLAGPAMAVGELDGAFVVQVDEVEDGRNWDANAAVDRNLIGWLDPQDASPVWRFNHASFGSSYTTATWMGELPGRTRLGIAFAESSNGSDLNNDNDEDDSVPTFADLINGSPRRLGFPGFATALEPNNAGISLSNGWGFFRVSEVEESRDINNNGQGDDILLVRLNLTTGAIVNMGALNTLSRSSIATEPDGISPGGAFLFDETIIGLNISGDNDAGDLVVRFFRLP